MTYTELYNKLFAVLDNRTGYNAVTPDEAGIPDSKADNGFYLELQEGQTTPMSSSAEMVNAGFEFVVRYKFSRSKQSFKDFQTAKITELETVEKLILAVNPVGAVYNTKFVMTRESDTNSYYIALISGNVRYQRSV